MSVIQHLLNHMHAFLALIPVADAFAGTKYTLPCKMTKYDRAHFLAAFGAGATGTTKITAEACSDSSGTGATAIPFQVSKQAGADAADSWSDYEDVAAAGYDTPAAANKLHLIQVRKDDMPDGKPWLRLKLVEQVDSPMAGAIICVLTHPAYPQMPPVSVLS
jgi:hypothetical protein